MQFEVVSEAFLARLAPIYSEVTLGAVRHLKFEEYPAHAALAAFGGLTALVLYYVAGILLRRMPERVSTEEQQARIEAMRKAAGGWVPYLLILAPTPVGGVVVMATAFFRYKLAIAVPIILAAEVLFRAMPYLR